MAKKSKSQRAKASAKRQERKEQARVSADDQVSEVESTDKGKFATLLEKTPLKGSPETEEERLEREQREKEEAKRAEREQREKEKNKKDHFRFFKEVRSEMKRVTWPSRTDVTRWSVVVVGALVFFSCFVLFMDNLVVTPLLYLISSFA